MEKVLEPGANAEETQRYYREAAEYVATLYAEKTSRSPDEISDLVKARFPSVAKGFPINILVNAIMPRPPGL